MYSLKDVDKSTCSSSRHEGVAGFHSPALKGESTKPVLLFYCQHSLGMGHLIRAMSLAEAFTQRFQVVFLNGGRFPKHLQPSAEINVVNLPPLGMQPNNQLYSQDENYTLAEAHAIRKQMVLNTLLSFRPQVVFIELFPFGRKKFAGELLPLLKNAQRLQAERPLVVCSLRDIMVSARKDQERHDNRARWLVNRYFDAVLVHADPKFASLEESFRPSRPLNKPVLYTGFVLPVNESKQTTPRLHQLLVTVGGGMVGAPLLKLAVKAQAQLWAKFKLPMTLVAGPFLPEADWEELLDLSRYCPGLTLHRYVSDMGELLATHSLSVSQCGYNTVMDLLKSGISALVVPFAEGQEDEQTNRAKRLTKLGLLKMVEAQQLDVSRFISEIEQLIEFKPNPTGLNLDGANGSNAIIDKLLLTGTFQRIKHEAVVGEVHG